MKKTTTRSMVWASLIQGATLPSERRPNPTPATYHVVIAKSLTALPLLMCVLDFGVMRVPTKRSEVTNG